MNEFELSDKEELYIDNWLICSKADNNEEAAEPYPAKEKEPIDETQTQKLSVKKMEFLFQDGAAFSAGDVWYIHRYYFDPESKSYYMTDINDNNPVRITEEQLNSGKRAKEEFDRAMKEKAGNNQSKETMIIAGARTEKSGKISVKNAHSSEVIPPQIPGRFKGKQLPLKTREEIDFWEQEVANANDNRNADMSLWEKIRKMKEVESVYVHSIPDYEYPEDRDMDWDTYLSLYADPVDDKFYAALYTWHPSIWDCFPVITGGQISLADYKRYLKRLGVHSSYDLPDSIDADRPKRTAKKNNDTLIVREGCVGIASGFKTPKSVRAVILPNSVKTIGDEAFCSAQIKEIKLPVGLQYIERSAFRGSKLERIVIPASVKKIDIWAFKDCNNLAEIIVEGAHTEIEWPGITGRSDQKQIIIKAPKNSNAFLYCKEHGEKFNLKFVSI